MGEGVSVSASASREGHQIFTTELTRFADRTRDRRIAAIIDDVDRPLAVTVRGRDGVGRGTVASALTGAGIVVTDDLDDPDGIDVVVVAEAVKAEDRAMLGARPALLVLNKADLAGFGAGGPIAVAERRAAEVRRLTGVDPVPMVALLAIAELDDELIAALRCLVTEPADLTSTDGFLSGRHSLPLAVRARLLDTVDLFGIAHGVLALRQGASPTALRETLRQISRIERVIAGIDAAGAEVRYRRVRAAITRLRAMAAAGERAPAEFLAADRTVIAVMATAVDVVRAAGVDPDSDPESDPDEPAAHLRRARRWSRYGRGPVDRLHACCAADIRRGSLRLLRGASPNAGAR